MDGSQSTYPPDNSMTSALSVQVTTDGKSTEHQGNSTGQVGGQEVGSSGTQSEKVTVDVPGENVSDNLQGENAADVPSETMAGGVPGDGQDDPRAVTSSEQTALPVAEDGSKLYNLLKGSTSGPESQPEMAEKVIDPTPGGTNEIVPPDKEGVSQRSVTEATTSQNNLSTTTNITSPTENFQEMVPVSWCTFKCKFCPKLFPDRKAWKKHIMDEHGMFPYACRYCDETYEHKHDLKEHERFHTSSRHKNKNQLLPEEIVPLQSTENPAVRHLEDNLTKENPSPKSDGVDLKSDMQHETPSQQLVSKDLAQVSQPKKEEKNFVSQATTQQSSKRKKHRHKTKSDLLKTLKNTHLQKKKNVVVVSVLDVMASDAARFRQQKPSGGASGALLSIVDQIRTTTEKRENAAEENLKGNYRLRAARKKTLFDDVDVDDDDDDELYRETVLYSPVRIKQKGFKRSSLKGRKTYQCRICPRVLSSNKVKIYHERGHPYPNECKVCHRAFQNKRDMSEHEEGHATGSWICRLCSDIFKDYPSYEVHQQIHQKEDKANQTFSCPYCSKVMKSKKSLEVHLRVHTGEKPYKCSFCEKSYRHYESWNYHENKHKGTLKQHVCQFCGKAFGGKYGLQVHERIHTGEKPYKCDHCNLAFSSNEKLKVHKDRVNGLAFVCQFCGKEFFTKANLNQHEMIHKGVKPHKCKSCEASFTSVTSLKYHTRTVHTGERYPCQFCNKQCKSKGQLTSHLRSHTDERPFKCKYCHKSFRNSNTLKTHEQGIHLGYRYTCDICKKDFSQRTALRTHDKLVHQGIKWKDLVLQRKLNRERRLAQDAAKLGQAAVDVKFVPGVTPPSTELVKSQNRPEPALPSQVDLPERGSPEPVKASSQALKLHQHHMIIPLSLAVNDPPGPSAPHDIDPRLSTKPVQHDVSVHSAMPMNMTESDQSSVDVAYQLATLASNARHLLQVRHSQAHAQEGLQVHVPSVHPGDSSVVDVVFPQDNGAPMYQTL